MVENQKAEVEFEVDAEPWVKRYSLAEKILLPVALLIAILYDRLIVAEFPHERIQYGIFGLCYMVIFYLFYRKRLKWDGISWFLASGAAALCLWIFIFSYPLQNQGFYTITLLVLPGVLMLQAQWATGAHTLRNVEGMAAAWCRGWLEYPFSGLPALFGAVGSLLRKNNKPVAKRALIGLFIAFLLMVIIVPLLMGAEQVFSHYLGKMIKSFNFFTIIFHSCVVIIVFGLTYSFLWNIGFKQMKSYRISETASIDIVISSIVLGCIMLLYMLFCLVLFTYLFAGAGLPGGVTYS
ncbi:MAG: hypothetical protein LBU70_02400, partial [Chitinispirillales bacterium]|nr:hypothetical protein [Chitinispirillales bacterium]